MIEAKPRIDDLRNLETLFREEYGTPFRKMILDGAKIIKDSCIKIYDCLLWAASTENPKWYYYYKNAKKSRTREKYRLLLQNKLSIMTKET
jgi:hypothetical protein